MPLVQSLDILRQRIANRTFKAVLDGVYDKVKAGTSLSDAFAAHAGLFPAVYSASLMAGERSGSLDAVIRRYVVYEKVIGAVRRRTISALIYPAILVVMMMMLIGIIVVRVVPAFSTLLRQLQPRAPSLDARHRRRVERARREFLAHRDRRRERCRVGDLVGEPSWSPRTHRSHAAGSAVGRRNRPEVFDIPACPDARHLDRWRHSAGQCARNCRAGDDESPLRRGDPGGDAARARRRKLRSRRCCAGRSFRTSQ